MQFRLIWLKKSSFTFDLPLSPWFFTSFCLWSPSLVLLNSFSLQILSFSNSCWQSPAIWLPTLIWDPSSSFQELAGTISISIATWIVKQVRDYFPAARVLLAVFFSCIFVQLISTGATLIFFKVKMKFEQWEGLSGAWFGFVVVVIDRDPSKVGPFEVLRGSGGGDPSEVGHSLKRWLSLPLSPRDRRFSSAAQQCTSAWTAPRGTVHCNAMLWAVQGSDQYNAMQWIVIHTSTHPVALQHQLLV